MIMRDLVSVIMPTYNRSKHIVDSVESVLAQSYKSLELIIVDDGSTDNTTEVLKPFLAEKRVRLIYQENAGAASARNHGVGLSSGRYIAFIDSDDMWDPDKLALQMAVFQALPDVRLTCSDFSAVDIGGKPLEESHIKSYFSVFKDYGLEYEDVFQHMLNLDPCCMDQVYWGNVYGTMLFGNLVLTSTVVCHRDVLVNVGLFDTRYETLEDYDLFLKITKKYNIAFLERPLVRYRYNENQLSGENYFGKLCVNLIDIFKKNVEAIEDEVFLQENRVRIKRHMGLIEASQGYYYFSRDEGALASAIYRSSICNNPFLWRSYIYLLFSYLPIRWRCFLRRIKQSFRD